MKKTSHIKPFKAGFKLNYTGGIKMKNSLVILASVLLIAGILGVVYAATQQTVTASVSISGEASITVDNSSIGFGTVSADGADHVAVNNPVVVTVVSNIGYSIKVSANQANFSNSTGTSSLVASNLKWATTLGGVYTGYTTSDAAVVSGQSPPGAAQNVFHKLTVPSGLVADVYNLPVTVKVTTP